MNYITNYFWYCDVMTFSEYLTKLKDGKDSPEVMNDLKRSLRLRFEHLKSLSTFNWKNSKDLCATFKDHD